jgi:hypothetical protein
MTIPDALAVTIAILLGLSAMGALASIAAGFGMARQHCRPAATYRRTPERRS